MSNLRRGGTAALSAFATFAALVASLVVVAMAPPPAAAAARDIALILDYRVVATCPVYPNYPKEGVIGNQIGWTITPSDIVGWRYNINNTWAMVSDMKYRKSSTNAWWGITQRACIGGSVGGEPFPTPESSYPAGVAIPNRILEGRSAVEADHYKTVDFRPSSATVINDYRRIDSKGTLRDAPNNFVIGNVYADWHVHQTNQRSQGWTKVYVPNAKRWGWVQDIHF